MPQLTQTETDGRHVLALEGEVTLPVAAELRATLLAALAAGGSLTLDLTAVEELDVAALQVLLSAQAGFESRQLACDVVDSPDRVWARSLAVAGIEIHPEKQK